MAHETRPKLIDIVGGANQAREARNGREPGANQAREARNGREPAANQAREPRTSRERPRTAANS
ncbi:hypothetical protein C3477_07555 [Mycobacterium kansasii]|uniref:hypothetical protein n=1 Tax=Mycobacterium kansasii TaxID=1768 RepID=UPI000CDDF742|nr:hypothetical protein [Mycobacterium kansasii]POX88232.1 hypothetical protein C3B43_14885 [Mycobacterium kansasii]POY07370.1 hypothetical protein C3477_07555 [Mycobacterium kansasii]POY19124.1 hypothetical protein C3476_18100 [Mycobacterium kansasii]